jgi:hypothetical protein
MTIKHRDTKEAAPEFQTAPPINNEEVVHDPPPLYGNEDYISDNPNPRPPDPDKPEEEIVPDNTLPTPETRRRRHAGD